MYGFDQNKITLFHCPNCVFRTPSEENYARHLTERHQKPYVSCCVTCCVEFGSPLEKHNHMETVHKFNKCQATVSMCSLPEALAKVDTDLACSFCCFKTNELKELRLHAKTCEAMSRQKLDQESNSDSGRGSGNASDAENPGTNRTADYRRKCRFNCLFRHNDIQILREHELVHHAKDRKVILEMRAKEKHSVRCWFCQKSIWRTDFFNHIRLKHKNALDSGVYRCRFCSFESQNCQDFDLHSSEEHAFKRVYEDDFSDTDEEEIDFSDYVIEPFKEGAVNFAAFGPKFNEEGKKFIYCQLCDFRTVVQYQMNKHKRTIHPNYAPLPCVDCGAKLVSYANLVGHLKERHRRPPIMLRKRNIIREIKYFQKIKQKEE